MSGASGSYGWFGTGVESVFGTSVTRDRWHEFISEGSKFNPTRKNAMGIHAGGLVALASQRQTVAVDASVQAQLYVPTKGFGRLLKQTCGAVATTTITGTPNAYKHSFTLAEILGLSLTIQVGEPRRDGTVVPYTYTGCKVNTFMLSAAPADFLTATINWNAQNMTTATAADTPTFPSGRSAFSWANTGMLLSIDSSPAVGVNGWDLTIDNKLKVDDFFAGGAGLKDEPVRNDWLGLTGNLTAAYKNNTIVDKFISGATASLTITFQNAQINSVPAYERLVVTLPAIGYNGDTPNVQGAAAPTLSIPYEVLDDGTNPPCMIDYYTTDATP